MKVQTIKTLLLTVIAFLTVLLIFQACEKTQTTSFVGTHILEKSIFKVTATANDKIWLEAKEFTDSRCPINVNCVWAGVATAKISFKDDTEEQIIELCKGACSVVAKPKTQEILIKNVSYIVELIDLTPYPGTYNKTETAKATITITKK
jgi:hypothetical protein